MQTSIKRILENELYIGVMVNHKTVSNKIRKPFEPLWNENPPPQFYEALLKEDLERERTGTLFSCEAHPPELDEEYLDMLAAEVEEELKSEGRLGELERKYFVGEADSQK